MGHAALCGMGRRTGPRTELSTPPRAARARLARRGRAILITQHSVLCRASGVVARTIAGETILVPVRRRAQEMGLFTLNGVGTFVWQALDGTHSLGEIAE